jgi:type IV secretion system protein VirB3
MGQLRETPFYSALHRPHLILGCDRELLLFVMFFAASLMISGAGWLLFCVGVASIPVSIFVLRRMTAADPLMWKIYSRQMSYSDYYAPFSRPHRISYSKRVY